MTKQRKLRMWVTIAAVLCLLAICAMSAWGTKNSFSNGLLLAMKLTGGAGLILLLVNAVLAVREFDRNRNHQKGK